MDDADDVAVAKTVASDRESIASGDTVASGAAALAGPHHDLPEVTTDRYKVGAEVGRGGLGRVLAARDAVLDRPVALKELLTTDPASHRRFVREALITARLQHPSIIPVYDAGRRTDRSPFYAMKLVGGRPLDRAIADAKTLAQRLALVPRVLAVADAIAYAHSQRIIHRDLKPANVLVGEFGETIVIDWGLAKDLSIDDRDAVEPGPFRSALTAQTVAGAVLGTPGYMAPEQAAGGEVDERTDVYALGAILYHVVSGKVPHEGTSVEEVIEHVITGDVTPLAEREPDAPSDLAAIVDKAMANVPIERYPTARELAEDLRRFQTGQLVGARQYNVGQRIARWIGRHRAISAVTAIAVLVLGAFATWSIGRISSERDIAIVNANRAITNEARAMLEQNPPAALAWLRRLSTTGPGWDAARTIAADALAHPQLDVVVHGGVGVTATADGRYAVGFTGTGIWIAELANGKEPTVVSQPRYQDPQTVMCDDNRSALVRTSELADALVVTIDLPSRRVDKRKFTDDTWEAALAHCRIENRLTLGPSPKHRPGVRLHDLATGQDRVLTTDSQQAGWFTADGAHLVTIDSQGAITRFDLKTGASDTINGIDPKFLDRPDHATFATHGVSSRDGSVVVAIVAGHAAWCDLTQKVCVPIDGDVANENRSIVVAPDGSWAWGETQARSWRIRRAFAWLDTGTAPPGDKYVSPDSAWLAALDHGMLRIQDVASGAIRVLRGHVQVRYAQFLPDNRLLTAGSEGSVRIWSLGKPARPHGLLNVRWVEFSPATRWFAIEDGDALVRRRTDGGSEDKIAWDLHARADFVIGDGGQVAKSARGEVAVWEGGTTWRALGAHAGAQRIAMVMLANGTLVTSSSSSLAIWEARGPRYIAIPDGTRDLPALEVDAPGRRARVKCGDAHCIIDLPSGRVDQLPGSYGDGLLSRDGRTALTSSTAGEHIVWDLDHLRERRRVHAADVENGLLGIANDGRRAMIKSESGVELVDLETGARTPLRSQSPQNISWAVFSPNGRAVLDSEHTLWDVASGEGRSLLAGFQGTGMDLVDDAVLAVGLDAVVWVADDLPRDPDALAAKLRALPYRLDEHDRLSVAR